MSHFPHGAIIAAQQARERRRRDEEEEEQMTKYTTEDLESNWEFKIVRSESGAFRKPEVFQNLLQEESIAGWELVEKLDNRRVRFKRPRAARRRDASLPPNFDPYRTNYGSSARSVIVIGIAVMLALMIGLAVLGIGMLDSSSLDSINLNWGTIMIWPMIVIVGIMTLVIGIIAIRRRG